MILLVVIFILPVTQCQVCYPGEDLQQCAKKFNPIKTAFVGNTSCLGTHRDKLGFLGVCTDNISHCQAGVYSDSLDCGSARICCQVSFSFSYATRIITFHSRTIPMKYCLELKMLGKYSYFLNFQKHHKT